MPKQKWVELFQTAEKADIASAVHGTSDALNQEIAGSHFHDARLGRRFEKLVRQLARKIGQTIPLACQDWTNTKAAYRFLSNRRVNEAAILAGHFHATRDRAACVSGSLLVIHDTTEFTYSREATEPIGILHKSYTGKDKDGRLRHHTVRGILMHSSLVLTTEGLPLGLAAIKFWTRDRFKGTNALKRSVNPTRVPIEQKESIRWLESLRQSTALLGEPGRCVHVGTGRAISTNSSAPLRNAARSLCCEPASTGLQAKVNTRSQQRCEAKR